MKTPDGYRVHEAATQQLSTLLAFAGGMVREFQVFVNQSLDSPNKELHVLLSAESLSSRPEIMSRNSAIAHEIIKVIQNAGWGELKQYGTLLQFKAGPTVSL